MVQFWANSVHNHNSEYVINYKKLQQCLWQSDIEHSDVAR